MKSFTVPRVQLLRRIKKPKKRKERRTKNIAEKEARVMEVTMEREFGKLEEKLVVVDEQFFDEADSSDENGP